jgi:hypothetical protein
MMLLMRTCARRTMVPADTPAHEAHIEVTHTETPNDNIDEDDGIDNNDDVSDDDDDDDDDDEFALSRAKGEC